MASTVKVGITAEDQGFKSTLDSMKSSANSFGNSLDDAGRKSQTLNGALRTAKKEAMDLALAYNQLSEAAKSSDFGQQLKTQLDAATQAAGRLQDIKSDVAENIKNIASDTAMWDATKQGISVVSSSLQSMSGIIGSLGGDVESFTRALAVMNTVQSVTNTIIGIGNALQKQSALMVGLRTVKNALFGASETAATVAETANTAATTVNTTAKGANAAATVASTTANTSNTVALGAATTAQLANNAAVLANPYVAAAAAVVALTGVIIAWCSSMSDATDEEAALAVATDALKEASQNVYEPVAKKIDLINTLKRGLEQAANKEDFLTKAMVNNKKTQETLQTTFKNTQEAMSFLENAQGYIDAAMKRARADAIHAATTTVLSNVLAELSDIIIKIQNGEKVATKSIESLFEQIGYATDKAQEMSSLLGLSFNKYKFLGGDFKYYLQFDVEDASEVAKKIAAIIQDPDSPIQNAMNKLAEAFETDLVSTIIETAEEPKPEPPQKPPKATKTPKTTTTTDDKKNIIDKKTQEEVEALLNSVEKCDAVIEASKQKIKELDKTSADYAENLKKLETFIYAARKEKYNLIDKSTPEGLAQAKSIIQEIINSLPAGHKHLEEWKKRSKEITELFFEQSKALYEGGGLEEQKKLLQAVDNVIYTLKDGDPELEKWVNYWKELHDSIEKSETAIKNLKNGIEKGSVADLQSQLAPLQKKLNNRDLSVDARIKIINEIADIQRQIEEKTKGKVSIPALVQPSFVEKGSKEDLRQSYTNANAQIQQISEDFSKGIIKNRKDAIDAVNEINQKLIELKLNPIEITFETDFDKVMEKINSGFSEFNSISGAVDSVMNLANSLDEGANAWEIFKNAISATQAVLESIGTIMTLINSISTIFATTQTAAAVATEGATAAETTKIATDAAAATTSATKTAANKLEEASLLDLAAAQIFAAHAYIPFAGVGIASGLVTGMMGAMAAQHAASAALQAFAEGGIVRGSTTMGDNILVRANAGEMLLTNKQQDNLFKLIDNGKLYDENGPQISTVKISGDDMYIQMHNYYKRTNKSPFER